MPQGLEEGKSSYQGRSHRPRVGHSEKSAEVIVVVENELRIDTAEVSQNDEGLNIKLFQMLQGGLNPEFTSLAISGTEQTNK